MTLSGSIPAHDVRHHAGWRVLRVASTQSTNTDLLAAVEAGEVAAPTALVADHQSAGRGRLDRVWDAPSGTNLLVSLLFLEAPPVAARLTQAVGLAAVHAIESLQAKAARTAGVAANGLEGRLGLKWPNDVLLDSKKLAGVLAQRSVHTGAVVVGIGLNVGWAPEGAASVRADAAMPNVTPADVLDGLLDDLASFPPNDPTVDVAARYRRRLLTIGQQVRVELPGGSTLLGVATDIDEAGRIVVEPDDGGVARVLDVGDIVHLRPHQP